MSTVLGLEPDAIGAGVGIRPKRIAMVGEGGLVKGLRIEQPGAFELSSAEAGLATL